MTRHSELHHHYQRRARQADDAHTQLADLQELIAKAHSAAAMLLSAGVAQDGGDEWVTGGGTSDPTLNALFQREWVNVHLGDIDTALGHIGRQLGDIRRACTTLMSSAREASGDDEMPNLLDTVDCRACGARISRQGNDRPIQGYCRACYEAWRRLAAGWVGPGGPDRAEFERTRRGDDVQAAKVMADRRRVTHLTIAGHRVPLTEAESVELTQHGDVLPQEVVEDLVARLRRDGRVPA